MYHFFVERSQIHPESVTITGPDVNHIKNVLRMKPGEQVLISNGEDRDYLCRLTEISADAVEAEILARYFRERGQAVQASHYPGDRSCYEL